MDDNVTAKRVLGNGRWDRKLKERMTGFSEADNYDDAKHEWRATGRCWWSKLSDREAPNWVERTGHVGKCLCGHDIVYHFEIENEVTGHRDVVGSDHINSYLILKEIALSTGIKEENITEAMIQEWIDVRVKSMKKEAWWEEHGEYFTEMFDNCKEMDLRINVRTTGAQYWDETLRMHRPISFLRKRAEGRNMGSIVWRWNHPDNQRAQINTRGYPNKKLMKDLTRFDLFLEDYLEQVEQEESEQADRMKYLRRLDMYEKDKIADAYKISQKEGKFRENCNRLGIPYFDVASGLYAEHERRFLQRKKRDILYMTDRNIDTIFTIETSQRLRDILDMRWGVSVKATPKQIGMFTHSGGTKPDGREMTMRECSLYIQAYKAYGSQKDRFFTELNEMKNWFEAKAKELAMVPETVEGE